MYDGVSSQKKKTRVVGSFRGVSPEIILGVVCSPGEVGGMPGLHRREVAWSFCDTVIVLYGIVSRPGFACPVHNGGFARKIEFVIVDVKVRRGRAFIRTVLHEMSSAIRPD